MLHRSLRRINRPALSVSVGREDFEKFATSHTLTHPYPPHNNPFQTPLLSCSLFPNSIFCTNTGNTAQSTFMNNPKSSVENRLTPNSNYLLQSVKFQPAQEKLGDYGKPHHPVSIGVFNVRMLMQIGRQASLAMTLVSLNVDTCCIWENRIQDPSTVLPLTCITTQRTFSVRISGDDVAAAVGQAGVVIALSQKAESVLLDWIPVNSHLCAARLNSSVRVNKNKSTRRTLLVISVNAPTDSYDDNIKNKFYADLNDLLHLQKASDIVIVAGDFNAQVGHLSSSETNIGGRFSLNARRTDNGERLLEFFSKHGLYLVSTNQWYKTSHLATWKSADPHPTLTQIDHITVSYRWRGSVQNCRCFWSTPLDSDHALVLLVLYYHSPDQNTIKHRIDTHKFNDHEIREKYQRKISEKLATERSNNANE